MGQLLLFSDIHIHPHKNSEKRLQDCLDVLKWVFEQAREKSVKNVIFLGDLFQDRLKIHVSSYQKAFEILEKYEDINTYLLVGNHDMWFHDNWQISSLTPLRGLNHVEVIDKPCSLEINGSSIDFLPYTTNPLNFINEFEWKSPILCAHLAVHGAQINTLYNTKSEVSVESEKGVMQVGVDVFDRWDRVFLGHYHGAQKLNGSVEYLGSPLQLNFSEAFQDKHISILNTGNFSMEYIENTFSPKHLIIPEHRLGEFDLDNNFVQIQVSNIHSTELLNMRRDLLKEHNVINLEFRETKKEQSEINMQTRDKFVNSEGEIFKRYIDAVGCGNLDKNLLMQIASDIIEN